MEKFDSILLVLERCGREVRRQVTNRLNTNSSGQMNQFQYTARIVARRFDKPLWALEI